VTGRGTRFLESDYLLTSIVLHALLRDRGCFETRRVFRRDKHDIKCPVLCHAGEFAATFSNRQCPVCLVPIELDGGINLLLIVVVIVLILVKCEVPVLSGINMQRDLAVGLLLSALNFRASRNYRAFADEKRNFTERSLGVYLLAALEILAAIEIVPPAAGRKVHFFRARW